MLNETRVGFGRLNLLSGLPEITFDVNGEKRFLPQFILTPYPIMGGSGALN